MTRHFDVLLEWLEHSRNYAQFINLEKREKMVILQHLGNPRCLFTWSF